MNGFIIVNKPLGYTSRDVVNEVSKILNTKKVGHTGTLDPNASGVMILCVGKALKMAEMLISHNKEYLVEAILGIGTDTLDLDKNATIIEEKDVNISRDRIKEVLTSFIGNYMQEVPLFSAVKVKGRKLYEYAREGKKVALPKHNVTIVSIQMLDDINYSSGKIEFTFRTTVSKGTYIRSLVRDIGLKLGVPAVVKSLVREKIDNFSIKDSFSLEDIKNNNYKLLTIQEVFNNINSIAVNDDVAFKIRNGVSIDYLFADEMAFILDNDNNLLALYKNYNGKCRPYKMFV